MPGWLTYQSPGPTLKEFNLQALFTVSSLQTKAIFEVFCSARYNGGDYGSVAP